MERPAIYERSLVKRFRKPSRFEKEIAGFVAFAAWVAFILWIAYATWDLWTEHPRPDLPGSGVMRLPLAVMSLAIASLGLVASIAAIGLISDWAWWAITTPVRGAPDME